MHHQEMPGRPGSRVSMQSTKPLTFLKRFFASPIAVGAVWPTSLATARIMASPVDPKGTVLEMGAGTGSITEGIVERLNDASNLTSVEIDPKLAEVFRKNFPQLRLEVRDAEDVLRESGGFDAIVSGVPLSIMEEGKRKRMLGLIKQKLNADGVFVAIQYSLVSKQELEQNFGTVDIKFSPLNVPPAFIYICRGPKT